MPWSTWKRLVQKKQGPSFFLPTVNGWLLFTSLQACQKKQGPSFLLPTVNDWLLFTSLKACHGLGHIFGASTSITSLTKTLAMSPSSTVHGGQYDTEYVAFELLLRAAFVSNSIRGFMLQHDRKHPSAFANYEYTVLRCRGRQRTHRAIMGHFRGDPTLFYQAFDT